MSAEPAAEREPAVYPGIAFAAVGRQPTDLMRAAEARRACDLMTDAELRHCHRVAAQLASACAAERHRRGISL